jgi:hypothetical protein
VNHPEADDVANGEDRDPDRLCEYFSCTASEVDSGSGERRPFEPERVGM